MYHINWGGADRAATAPNGTLREPRLMMQTLSQKEQYMPARNNETWDPTASNPGAGVQLTSS